MLKVLLGQVLKISLGKRDLALDGELVLVHGNGDAGSEVSGLVVNLDSLGKELLEVLENDNVVLNWESTVDEEFLNVLLSALGAFSYLLDHL